MARKKNNSLNNKILSWALLSKKIGALKKKKKKIVFTNGCFDLVHVGHLKVFEKCKSWGDVLVLGLNSDSSIRRLKGPKRPIISEKNRAQLLAGFELIDFVVIFKEDTPERLIKLIGPDVLVKGGDWKKDQIVGREYSKTVRQVPLIKGQSTSEIISKVVNAYGG